MRDVNCPICDADHYQRIETARDRLLGIPGEFQMVRCLECGGVYLNPQPTTDEILHYYPADYESYAGARVDELSGLQRLSVAYGLYKRRRAVTRYVSAGRLLEVGCATGAFLNTMRAAGDWEVYGVDISEHAVTYARERLGLNVFLGQLAEAQFPADYFDAVVMWDVLEHLPNPKAALGEVRRVLKDGGWLIFRVPNLDSWDAKLFGPYWAGFDAPRHFTTFSMATVRRLLEAVGFQWQDAACISGTYPTFVLSMRFWARDHLSLGAQRWLVRILNALPLRLMVAPWFRIVDWLKKSSVITVYARKVALAAKGAES
jgi:SAM-dependent methyltransferase